MNAAIIIFKTAAIECHRGAVSFGGNSKEVSIQVCVCVCVELWYSCTGRWYFSEKK